MRRSSASMVARACHPADTDDERGPKGDQPSTRGGAGTMWAIYEIVVRARHLSKLADRSLAEELQASRRNANRRVLRAQ